MNSRKVTIMLAEQPSVLLLVQTQSTSWHPTGGAWRFSLQTPNGETLLDANDIEPGVSGERLGLLTVVRGLEALEQESRVTLITDDRYVIRGMRYGLEEWREHDWKWSRFGELVDINHADLWRRLDNALRYHQLQCRHFRIDLVSPEQPRVVPKPHFARRRGRLLALPDTNTPDQQLTGEAGRMELPSQVGHAHPANHSLPESTWLRAASVLGQELARRWDTVAV